MPLWGGAFDEPSDADLRALNDSISFDRRMYKHDIMGSIAYARAIAEVGVITADEADQIVRGLEQIRMEFDAGTFEVKPGDEDIHTAVERRLTELIGTVGGKLHTGRSRNDQVATDFRLWTRYAIHDTQKNLRDLIVAVVEKAEQHLMTVMPGYTHLQPAQPVTAAHWLMSYAAMFWRDSIRLAHALREVDVMPLGAGALAGTPLTIDRGKLAEALGFTRISVNSLDAVSDRDFAAQTLFALTLLGVHLSRLAEDLILFSNPSLGFVTLDDRYSTGSSLMPQKRNPDPMELARGKAGRLIGNLTGLLATLKGLPTSYNKDLQEDKAPLFDAFDTLALLLPVITAVVRTLKLNPDKMRAALDENMLATDLADYLVAKGMPFREAHHIAGRAVRMAADKSVKLSHLTLDDWRGLSELFSEDVQEVFDFDASVARRKAAGGTALEAVQAQIDFVKSMLSE
jgi:argininosuccinate lyase